MWGKQKIIVPVEVSARHCHLSQQDLEKLFGEGHKLTKIKQLSQPSDFACEETVSIQFGSKKFENVRVVGPAREQTQVEISATDVAGSGVEIPLRLSGDLKGSAGVILTGPVGRIELLEGLIIAKRHIHCATGEAKKLKLKTGDIISVEVAGERPVIFKKVIVRVRDDYKLSVQVDTDEGNAAGIQQKSVGFLLR